MCRRNAWVSCGCACSSSVPRDLTFEYRYTDTLGVEQRVLAPVTVGAGKEWGLSLATPVIVKYRDERTDARTELERWLR